MSHHLRLLDTNICVHLLRGDSEEVRAALKNTPRESLAVSTLTVFELRYGTERSHSPERARTTLDLFLRDIAVIPFDAPAAAHAAEIRAALRAQPIGPYDLLIAGHARSLGATLVTRNVKEFKRVPGLKVVAW